MRDCEVPKPLRPHVAPELKQQLLPLIIFSDFEARAAGGGKREWCAQAELGGASCWESVLCFQLMAPKWDGKSAGSNT